MIFGQNRENKNSVSPLLYSEKWITFSTTFAFACGLLNHTSSIATGYLIICGFDPGVISRYPLLFTEHAGKAMDYTDVDNLFRKLRKKTGIYITPHMFRHTSLSLLNSAGWDHMARPLIKRLGQEEKADSFACAGVEHPRAVGPKDGRDPL